MSDELADKPSHGVVGRLYVEHHAWLTKWLRLRLGNAHEAADLAQDTFERLLRFRLQDPIQEPRAYLTVVARRLVISRAALEQAYAEALAQAPQCYEVSPEQHMQVMLDKVYYRTVGSSALGNYYGEPRNWMLTLRGAW